MSTTEGKRQTLSDSYSSKKLKSRATIRIFGAPLNFDLISQNLNLRPTRVHRMGEKLGPGGPFTHDLWSVDAPLDRTERLDKHLLWLKTTVEPHGEFLTSLKGTARVRSFCGIIADGRECSFTLSAEALSLFVKLGIDLELSLIFLGNPDGEDAPPELGAIESNSRAFRTETRLFFDLFGNNIDIAITLAQLRIKPSEVPQLDAVDSAGDQYARDAWSLAVPVDPKEGLDRHLKWLGDFLSHHVDFISSISGHTECFVRCEFGTETDTGGVGISPESLRVPVELGLPLQLNARLI